MHTTNRRALHRFRVVQEDVERVVGVGCTASGCHWSAELHGNNAHGEAIGHLMRAASRHTLDTRHETVFTIRRETHFRIGAAHAVRVPA